MRIFHGVPAAALNRRLRERSQAALLEGAMATWLLHKAREQAEGL
jgi:hypothetical protein